MLLSNFEQIAIIANDTEFSYQHKDATIQILDLLPLDSIDDSVLREALPVDFIDGQIQDAIEKQSIDDLIERIDEKLFQGTKETEIACKAMLSIIGDLCPGLLSGAQSNDDEPEELIGDWWT